MDQQRLELTHLTDNPAQPLNDLTLREVEVLRWCAEGNTAEEVGDVLTLKSRTVNFHIKNAVRKMGARNKMSAVVQALRSGFF